MFVGTVFLVHLSQSSKARVKRDTVFESILMTNKKAKKNRNEQVPQVI